MVYRFCLCASGRSRRLMICMPCGLLADGHVIDPLDVHELLHVSLFRCLFCFSSFNAHASTTQDPARAHCSLVLFCSDDPKPKANAALIMALYIVRDASLFACRFPELTVEPSQLIVKRKTPSEAFHRERATRSCLVIAFPSHHLVFVSLSHSGHRIPAVQRCWPRQGRL